MKNLHRLFVLFFLIVFASHSFADSPYKSWSNLDRNLFAASAIGGFTSLYLEHHLQPLTEDHVGQLIAEQINPIDRIATTFNSELAANWSDWGMRTCLLLPLALLADERVRNDGKTAALLYFETMALTGVLTELSKTTFQRVRPYAYNEETGMSTKLAKDTKKAFFSGHTSASFAGAVLFAKLCSDYHPDSKWKPYVWAGSLTVSGLVGYWRIRAGRHFPTDVIAGALVGGAIGYWVPELHKKSSPSVYANATSSPMMFSFQFSF